MTATSTVQTPLGPFTILIDDGAVLASGWTAELADLLPLVAPGLRPRSVSRRADLGELTDAVCAYHQGELSVIADIPVRLRGGAFLEHAWQVLRTVPAGAPVSYTELAAKAGQPRAVRAAASACARNPAALFVPCHRVLRGDGSLGGFRWGLPAKRWLLAHSNPSRTEGRTRSHRRSATGGRCRVYPASPPYSYITLRHEQHSILITFLRSGCKLH